MSLLSLWSASSAHSSEEVSSKKTPRLSSQGAQGQRRERRASPSKSWIFHAMAGLEKSSRGSCIAHLMEKEGLWSQAELGSSLSSCNLWKKTG